MKKISWLCPFWKICCHFFDFLWGSELSIFELFISNCIDIFWIKWTGNLLTIDSYWTILIPIRQFWFILGNSDSYWTILIPIGQFWFLLGNSYSYWEILIPIGQFWFLLGNSDSYWTILIPIGQFWFLLDNSDSYWAILIPFGQFWFLLDNSDSYWTILIPIGQFWFLLDNSVKLLLIFSQSTAASEKKSLNFGPDDIFSGSIQRGL
jgi:hypothetical protein